MNEFICVERDLLKAKLFKMCLKNSKQPFLEGVDSVALVCAYEKRTDNAQ